MADYAGEFTKLGYRDVGATGVYTYITNKVSVTGPNIERAVVDHSTMPEAVGTSYRKKRPSNLLDPGTLELQANVDFQSAGTSS